MNLYRKIIARWNKTLKYSASDPKNFEEVWSFQSNRIRLFSLLLLVFILLTITTTYFFGGLFGGGQHGSVDRSILEAQRIQLDSLSKRLQNQEEFYMKNLRAVISGEVPGPSKVDSVGELKGFNVDTLNVNQSTAEKQLAKKIKEELRTPAGSKSSLVYFGSPLLGVVSQGFDAQKHPAIDVVTTKDEVIKSCLAGTVIYAGFSRKDGYIIIIEHPGNFISIYKHAKTVLKKIGNKVQLGDPIAIVGNTGENTDGPHLHFELWYNQVAVNPSDYISFTKK